MIGDKTVMEIVFHGNIYTAKQAESLTVGYVINIARDMTKGEWASFNTCKRMLNNLPLTPGEYDTALKRITEILQI